MQCSYLAGHSAAVLGARIISYLLHPMLMPVYTLLFVFEGKTIFAVTPVTVKLYCLMVSVLTLLLLPLASLPVFRHYGLITEYGLNDRQERVYPILVAVLFAFLGFWLLGKMPYTGIVRQLYLLLVILLSVFSVITMKWKMSMHMTGMGGLCGLVFVLGCRYGMGMQGCMAWLFLAAGLLGSARLYLGKHNPAQIYTGFVFGFCFMAGMLF